MRTAAAEGDGKEEQSECQYKGRLGLQQHHQHNHNQG